MCRGMVLPRIRLIMWRVMKFVCGSIVGEFCRWLRCRCTRMWMRVSLRHLRLLPLLLFQAPVPVLDRPQRLLMLHPRLLLDLQLLPLPMPHPRLLLEAPLPLRSLKLPKFHPRLLLEVPSPPRSLKLPKFHPRVLLEVPSPPRSLNPPKFHLHHLVWALPQHRPQWQMS